jgi:hypothetical protein
MMGVDQGRAMQALEARFPRPRRSAVNARCSRPGSARHLRHRWDTALLLRAFCSSCRPRPGAIELYEQGGDELSAARKVAGTTAAASNTPRVFPVESAVPPTRPMSIGNIGDNANQRPAQRAPQPTKPGMPPGGNVRIQTNQKPAVGRSQVQGAEQLLTLGQCPGLRHRVDVNEFQLVIRVLTQPGHLSQAQGALAVVIQLITFHMVNTQRRMARICPQRC